MSTTRAASSKQSSDLDTPTDPRVEHSRQKVMSAARAIMLDEGIHAVTVEAVMQRSGVARATVYRHWESREALVRAAVLTMLPAVESPAIDLPFEQQLRSLMRQLAQVTLSEDWQRFFPILIESVNRISGLEGTRERVTSLQRSMLSEILERGIADGSLPPDTNVTETALMLLGPLVLAALDRSLPTSASIADTLVTRLLASL